MTPPAGNTELLTRDEVQARYGLSRRWLELAAHRGEGPAMVKISRRMVRYRAADIEAFINARVIGGDAAA